MNVTILENHLISVNTVRRRLITALMEEGYHVTILSTGTQNDLSRSAELGFKVVDVGASSTNPFTVLQYLHKLRKEILKNKTDVCLTFTMRPAIWGNLITRLQHIPTITNITGTGPLTDSTSYIYRIARWLYRVILKRTKVVFFQNNDDKNFFLHNGYISPSQAIVIPGSGIEVNQFIPQEKQEDPDHFSFLFISRLLIDKGTLEYAGAAKNLHQKYGAKVQCHIVGPYWEQNYKSNTITEADVKVWTDEEYIIYHGPSNDVRFFIANADCIVLPSYREGMSNVLLEAASMARPAIAANVTGCKDIIVDGETGYLCEVKSIEDLTQKMDKMMNLPACSRKEMGMKARERMITFFDKSIVINAYLDAINKSVKK